MSAWYYQIMKRITLNPHLQTCPLRESVLRADTENVLEKKKGY